MEAMAVSIDPLQLAIGFADRYVKGNENSPNSLDSTVHRTWHYENGCVLKAVEAVWRETGDGTYLHYIIDRVNRFVQANGEIRGYTIEEYNLDNINEGKVLFNLFHVTGDARYKQAIELLVTQMRGQPRTKAGGFWHKKIYPFQMWLDGVYMASPFLARYAYEFNDSSWFDDVALQILTMEEKARNAKTGLLYHAWDESFGERWANPCTGCSPHFWSRAIGWFTMAIVDVLDYLPLQHPKRGQIVGVFHRLMKSIVQYQDVDTSLWYQVTNLKEREDNYGESSSTAMFLYSLSKGIRKGYLDNGMRKYAERAYAGLLQHRVVKSDGVLHLTHCNAVAGLGNTPYRDGSYEYYVGERVTQDDPKAVGPFIMACFEYKQIVG